MKFMGTHKAIHKNYQTIPNYMIFKSQKNLKIAKAYKYRLHFIQYRLNE